MFGISYSIQMELLHSIATMVDRGLQHVDVIVMSTNTEISRVDIRTADCREMVDIPQGTQ